MSGAIPAAPDRGKTARSRFVGPNNSRRSLQAEGALKGKFVNAFGYNDLGQRTSLTRGNGANWTYPYRTGQGRRLSQFTLYIDGPSIRATHSSP